MDKDLVRIINQTISDANYVVACLTDAKDLGFCSKNRLIDSGNMLARLAAEMYVAAGAVKDE